MIKSFLAAESMYIFVFSVGGLEEKKASWMSTNRCVWQIRLSVMKVLLEFDLVKSVDVCLQQPTGPAPCCEWSLIG